MARFESYPEFEAGFPTLVSDMLGVETDWNGVVRDYHGGTVGPIGEALPDGTVELTEQVRDVLRDAYAHRGQADYSTPERQFYVATALKVTLHESIHLAARPGRMSREAAFDLVDGVDGIRTLEEGVTELATMREFAGYIRELGFDEIVPGIAEADYRPAYAGQVAAVNGLLDQIERETGLDRDELLTALATSNRAEKYGVLATALGGTETFGSIPESEIERRLRHNLTEADLPELFPRRSTHQQWVRACEDIGRLAVSDLGLSPEAKTRDARNTGLGGVARAGGDQGAAAKPRDDAEAHRPSHLPGSSRAGVGRAGMERGGA